MRKNPELEPLRQSVVVYNLVLATPPTALVTNCNSFAVPLDQSATWRGGGDVLHISSPRHTSELASHTLTNYTTNWRGHSSFALRC